MPGSQELQRRIKSVKSTRKITRAMQMVSAAKMRKSQTAASSSRGYTTLAMEMLSDLKVASQNPLLKTFPDAKKIAIIAISSNKGLVGSFNSNILLKIREIEKENPDMQIDIVGKGKKVCEACTRMGKHLVAHFTKVDTTVGVNDIYDLAKLVYEKYVKGEYKTVYVVYNHFYSTLVQKVNAVQLLPFTMELSEPSEEVEEDLTFEPSPSVVLDHLLPRIIESQIYQALLESDASEHSSRMVMMKNATEAAGDIISDLTLTYNQLRQNKITTELSEITAGKIALENK